MSNWIEKWQVTKSDGKSYIVAKADNGSWGCSCPAWTLHRTRCKHIAMVSEGAVTPTDYTLMKIMGPGIEPTAPVKEPKGKRKVKKATQDVGDVGDVEGVISLMSLIKQNAQY